ncbi:MAG: DUF2752 domain-containing protein [Ignavibacteriales bacterium]|nr:DUF2752 domain-containing protein [Ignavibacteriales bacterium]
MFTKYSIAKPFIVLICVVGFCGILFFASPNDLKYFVRCPFHSITGLYCPGCGSLRGCYAIIHGDVLKALDYNFFMVLSIPFLAYSLALFFIREITKKPSKGKYIKPVYLWSLLISILVFWILRNIPVYPFNILAP